MMPAGLVHPKRSAQQRITSSRSKIRPIVGRDTQRSGANGQPEQWSRTWSLSPPPHAPKPEAQRDSADASSPRRSRSSTISRARATVMPSLAEIDSTVAPDLSRTTTRSISDIGLGGETIVAALKRTTFQSGKLPWQEAMRQPTARLLPPLSIVHRFAEPVRQPLRDTACK